MPKAGKIRTRVSQHIDQHTQYRLQLDFNQTLMVQWLYRPLW